jgi:Tol biopolymer transport system component
MADLKERFRSLDRVPAPDLWRDISRRQPADLSLGPSRGRIAVAALAFVVAAAGIGVAVKAFVLDKQPRTAVHPIPIARKANGKIAFTGVKGHGFSPGLSDARIYLANDDGTEIHGLVRGKEPAWSPDGSRIAYVVGGEFPRYELHVLDVVSGKDERILLNKQQFMEGPSWSPDGQQIVVAIGGSNRGYALYILNSDGSDLHRITDMTGSAFDPAWSPQGSQIVFAASEETNSALTNLYVVRPDGTGLRRLTRSDHFQKSPTWSPDGRRIAFVDGQGQDHPSSIAVMNADGSMSRSLFTCTDCLIGVDWAPDGTKLLFGRVDHSSWHIWSMNADGSDLKVLQTGQFQALWPAWQPVPVTSPRPPISPTAIPSGTLPLAEGSHGGGTIAYVIGDGLAGRIWIAGADGSHSHVLAPGTDPAWSPDGHRIAFRTNFEGTRNDLAVVDEDGTNLQILVSGVQFGRLPAGGGAPSWSALIFAAPEGLFLVDISGGMPQLLTHQKGCLEYDPAWAPDESSIAFAVGCSDQLHETEAGISVVNPDGSGRHRVVGVDSLSLRRWDRLGPLMVATSPSIRKARLGEPSTSPASRTPASSRSWTVLNPSGPRTTRGSRSPHETRSMSSESMGKAASGSLRRRRMAHGIRLGGRCPASAGARRSARW